MRICFPDMEELGDRKEIKCLEEWFLFPRVGLVVLLIYPYIFDRNYYTIRYNFAWESSAGSVACLFSFYVSKNICTITKHFSTYQIIYYNTQQLSEVWKKTKINLYIDAIGNLNVDLDKIPVYPCNREFFFFYFIRVIHKRKEDKLF